MLDTRDDRTFFLRENRRVLAGEALASASRERRATFCHQTPRIQGVEVSELAGGAEGQLELKPEPHHMNRIFRILGLLAVAGLVLYSITSHTEFLLDNLGARDSPEPL